MVVPLKSPGKQLVKRGFSRLVERGRGLVQKKIIGRLENGARDAETLLLAEREHAVPVGFLIEALREVGQPDGGDDFRQALGREGPGFVWIRDS